jgi:hypothetical protein
MAIPSEKVDFPIIISQIAIYKNITQHRPQKDWQMNTSQDESVAIVSSRKEIDKADRQQDRN